MQRKIVGIMLLLCIMVGLGCSSNQTLKNVWKGTRSFWYSTVNVPASIDYDDSGSLDKYEELLARSVVGIDKELIDLEKTMNNADRLPTPQWIRGLLTRYTWLSGITIIKDDTTMVAQIPGPPIKSLDFHPLFNEDPKQNRRALRGYVQDTPMGPEILLAMPVYDAQTFRGLVSVYFDIRNLLNFSESPDDLIIIAPNAILWSGKYNFAGTPMAGIHWDTILLEANSGTVTNPAGTFYWSIRYLGNVPLIFAVPVKGSFGENTPTRNGPTSEGPFAEVKPLKMPPPPPEIVPPPPVPVPQQRRVVRRRVMMPMMPMQPIVPEERIEPVRMPSPLHDPRPRDTDEEKTTETPASAPTQDEAVEPQTSEESSGESSSESSAGETESKPQEGSTEPEADDKSAEPSGSAEPATPEPQSSGRPSPFGPK